MVQLSYVGAEREVQLNPFWGRVSGGIEGLYSVVVRHVNEPEANRPHTQPFFAHISFDEPAGGSSYLFKPKEVPHLTYKEVVGAGLRTMRSPKKVNLVAALVRGMRVEDALLQLQVTVKRAAKTVYQVIHSARANATHNHGLDPDRLLIAEAFVGKGLFKKRISYHAKGKCGMKVRPECRLTVVVRELTPEEEAEIARLRVNKFLKLTKRERRLVPHELIETTPVWNRKSKVKSHVPGVMAA
ncbi:unnamed protein product [Ilex paraguariensis]|uniref:Large ribosomal subunit protein uL22c n=1 Tax=Ilex paraguariensis TaxID=185542 RepID=A0ABC8TF47_9AQUA